MINIKKYDKYDKYDFAKVSTRTITVCKIYEARTNKQSRSPVFNSDLIIPK